MGLAVGEMRFSGASVDTAAGSSVSQRPYRPTTLELRVDRGFGRIGLGLGLLYASPGLAQEDAELAVVLKDAFDWLEIAPEASFRLVRKGAGVAVRAHAGPIVDLWDLGDESRSLVGAQAALSVDAPLFGRLTGSVRAGAAVTRSLFQAGEPPPGFETRAMWRRSLSLGLRYRL
jgi:hypothetical protein